MQIAETDEEICQRIDKKISGKDHSIYKNLRLYCLKLLRKSIKTKEISERYIKIDTYEWCKFFKEDLKEEQSRAIFVPKLPSSTPEALRNL